MLLVLASIALLGHVAWSLSDGAARVWYASHARGCVYCRFVPYDQQFGRRARKP